MNARITEKVYKRKFQKFYAPIMSQLTHEKVPPSRIKFEYRDEPDAHVLIALWRGYEFTVTFTSKGESND